MREAVCPKSHVHQQVIFDQFKIHHRQKKLLPGQQTQNNNDDVMSLMKHQTFRQEKRKYSLLLQSGSARGVCPEG
ncbi:hypothetical protein Leryth_014612 [Lithospermum erythrorhizon]|nr:hypothetical protein Leryth_014612 [Lithospermum erythrorhizon]